jgi:pyruvate ferredoxin oxidoreductase gamma subunit
VLQGASARCVMLINSAQAEETWRKRLNYPGTLLTLAAEAAEPGELRFAGAASAGAAARLLGVVSRASLEAAIRAELAALGTEVVGRNLAQALDAFQRMRPHAGCVREGAAFSVAAAQAPDWIELPLDESGACCAR